jgi:UDP-glucuronate decarboxylase
MKIGIVGNGFVGKATQLLKCDEVDVIVYDIIPKLCIPIGTTLEDIDKCDLVFLCLPTPMNHDSSNYTNLLEDTIQKLTNKFIVIRSTVHIGFSESQKCYFMPEFLTELYWKDDFVNSKYWVFGCLDSEKQNEEFKSRITTLIQTCKKHDCIKSDTIHFLTNSEAESLKLIKNTFLACKVSYMNEMYEFLQEKKVNYDNVKKILSLDSRIGSTHMNVPGYHNKRGFGGTCFPKDTHNLYSQIQQSGMKSYLVQACLDRNDGHDRKEREWATDKWRTTLPVDKKISLVTGGAGFIGSHLCKALLELGHYVICLDNLYTSSLQNISEFKDNENFMFKKADIRNKQFFPHIDYIWHLACPASPPKYQRDGYYTMETCILGTMNVLELAKVHSCSLLYTSTSEIYGDPLEHPQKETYWGNVNPVGPRSCYDESKRCGETLIYQFAKQNAELSNKLKIVRIFNTYGTKMDLEDGRVITNFIQSIKSNQPIEIYGDGKQTRSFCYVDDMVSGLIKMMFSNSIGPINLGNPHEEMNMFELLSNFETIVNKKLELIHTPLPINDPRQRKPDISLAIEQLNWEPKISLKEGLKKTIQFYN